MRIIQIVDGFKKGDGVGNAAMAIGEFFDRHGIENYIFKRALVESDLDSDFFAGEAVVIYHLAVALDPLIQFLPCIKILAFQNITQPELLGTFDEETRILCSVGWYDLPKTKDIFCRAITFSDYSKHCLVSNGWEGELIDVLPIPVRLDKLHCQPDASVLQRYNDGKTNLLFAGRVYPNKKHEDAIAAFAFYHKKYNEKSRLIFVGSVPTGRYYPSLLQYARQLGVEEDVVFTGRVSLAEYVAYFNASHLFLCMSEHEGFCIPLVEAMFFGLPIVAYNATAVPDTLQGAGVLVNTKAADEVAATIDNLLTDEIWKQRVLQGEEQRLRQITGEALEAQYEKSLLNTIYDIAGGKANANNARKSRLWSVDTILDKEINIGAGVVIYGAGAAGTILFVRLRSKVNDICICDNGRAGEFDDDLGCEILSPKSVLLENPDAVYIISIQNRRIAFDVSYELLSGGAKKDRIFFFDRLKDQIL